MSDRPPLPTLSVTASEALLKRTSSWVEEYMSQPRFDASHDFTHVRRVTALAKHILRLEQVAHPEIKYDPLVVEMAALMHDVDDHKYNVPQLGDFSREPRTTSLTPVEAQLLSLSCPASLARTVSTITSHTSYSFSLSHPAQVASVLSLHPELAIVQDADRLDAMGAIGIGRAFAYGGARGRGLEDTIIHLGEKLEKLEGGMRTEGGRGLAMERGERLRAFRNWWEQEMRIVVELERENGRGGQISE